MCGPRRSHGGGTHYKPETRFHRDAAFGEIMGSCEGFHFGTHLQDMPKDIILLISQHGKHLPCYSQHGKRIYHADIRARSAW